MIKKIMNKISYGLMGLGALLVPSLFVKAAPDTDLGTALSSSTAFATDNKSQILTYIVGIIVVVFVITIAKKAVLWGFSKIAGVFGKGRRRR